MVFSTHRTLLFLSWLNLMPSHIPKNIFTCKSLHISSPLCTQPNNQTSIKFALIALLLSFQACRPAVCLSVFLSSMLLKPFCLMLVIGLVNYALNTTCDLPTKKKYFKHIHFNAFCSPRPLSSNHNCAHHCYMTAL